jgi:hypothetical protein
MGGPLITKQTKSKKQNSKLSLSLSLSLSRLLAGISPFSTDLAFFRCISLSLAGNPRISPELPLFWPSFSVNSLSRWISPDVAFSRHISLALAENPRISLNLAGNPSLLAGSCRKLSFSRRISLALTRNLRISPKFSRRIYLAGGKLSLARTLFSQI